METFNYDYFGNLAVNDLQAILMKMQEANGSDIILRSNDYVRMSIFGRKRRVTKRKVKEAEVFAILGSIYGDNAKTLLGSKEAIDKAYEFKTTSNDDGIVNSNLYRYRMCAVGFLKDGTSCVSITFRGIPTEPKSARLSGVEQEILSVCDAADQGLILVVGATGNGKSTLLSGILVDQLNDPEHDRSIITIESPIETVYDKVSEGESFITQREVGTHVKSFSSGVHEALRMAPTTIVVGEARDYETISAAIEASNTGHIVFSTVHANSVAETFQRMISVYQPEMQHQARFDLIQSIRMVIAQRLIPSSDGRRVAVREFLALDQKMKDYLLEAKNLAVAVNEMVSTYGRPMMRDIKSKYDEGRISQAIYDRMRMNYEYQTVILKDGVES